MITVTFKPPMRMLPLHVSALLTQAFYPTTIAQCVERKDGSIHAMHFAHETIELPPFIKAPNIEVYLKSPKGSWKALRTPSTMLLDEANFAELLAILELRVNATARTIQSVNMDNSTMRDMLTYIISIAEQPDKLIDAIKQAKGLIED